VTLCSGNTDFDTKLEIFTFEGTDCSLTYTDGITTGNYNDDATCSFSGLYSSLIGITLAPGQYYIVVDGFSGATGNFEINVTESTGRAMVENAQDDFDLELLKSGLEPRKTFLLISNIFKMPGILSTEKLTFFAAHFCNTIFTTRQIILLSDQQIQPFSFMKI